MSTRRRFTGEFKAKVALEALRGDKTIQEIAAQHKVHPNQVSAWKQRAVEGMREVFSKGAERSRGDHEGEIRDLHAKIGLPPQSQHKPHRLSAPLPAQPEHKVMINRILAA